MQILILVFVVSLSCLSSISEASRGLSLPHGMEQEDYCKGCIETVSAIVKKQKNGMSTKKIVKGMEKMCNSMKEGNNKTSCLQLVDHHIDDLESVLEHPEKSKKLISHFCFEHSFACTGLRTYSSQIKHEKSEEELEKILADMEPMKRVPNPVRKTDEL
uniref:uncharacterized protein LOC120347244 n=1 Tax=Styela clava TaxID=7725 RepID=UPI001939F2E7|nr:uncharacterized protein LOC120347244 [Styela clava]